MTERESIAWEMHEQGIIEQVTHLGALLATIPDTMRHTATRNCVLMAMNSLETARDQLAAARARMPKETNE